MMYWFAWSVAGIWLRLCYRLRAVGRENIPAEGGVLLASNHSSFIDPMAIGCAHFRKTTFIARGSLKDHFAYAMMTKGLDIVSIDTERGDREVLRTVAARLQAGSCCAVFPEGTRSADGTVKQLKRGFAMFAKRAAVPVVPVWVEGAYEAWPRHQKRPRLFGRIEVRFGPPFHVDDPKAAPDQLRDALARLAGHDESSRQRTKVRTEAPSAGPDPDRPTAQGCGTATEGVSTVDAHPIT